MSGPTGAASRHALLPTRPPGDPGARRSGAGAGLPRWHRESRLPLGALSGAVPCARLHTRHVVKEWRLGPLADPAELVVSELVTNALHASWALPGSQAIWLRLMGDSQRLMIEVWDAHSAPPEPHSPEPGEEGGRGLLLVASFSQEWGYYHLTTGGKVVWAILTLASPR